MESYDGAEVCELVSIFMLSLIGSKYNPNNYKDDGVAVFESTSGPQSEKIKKSFQKNVQKQRFRHYHKMQLENS